VLINGESPWIEQIDKTVWSPSTAASCRGRHLCKWASSALWIARLQSLCRGQYIQLSRTAPRQGLGCVHSTFSTGCPCHRHWLFTQMTLVLVQLLGLWQPYSKSLPVNTNYRTWQGEAGTSSSGAYRFLSATNTIYENIQ